MWIKLNNNELVEIKDRVEIVAHNRYIESDPYRTGNFNSGSVIDYKLVSGNVTLFQSTDQVLVQQMFDQIVLQVNPIILVNGIRPVEPTLLPPQYIPTEDEPYYTCCKMCTNWKGAGTICNCTLPYLEMMRGTGSI